MPGIHNILLGNEAASKQAARLFLSKGHVRTAFVAGPAESAVSDARLSSFRLGLADSGALEPLILPGDYLVSGGLAAAAMLIGASVIPDAVLCVNDLTAIGLIDGLCARGCQRLPAVISFDDIPAAHWRPYELTTFKLDVEAMASLGIECFDREFEPAALDIVVPSQLIVRSSA